MPNKNRFRQITSDQTKISTLETSLDHNQEFKDKLFTLIGKLDIRHVDALQIAILITQSQIMTTHLKKDTKTKSPSLGNIKNFEDDLFNLIGQYNFSHRKVIAILRNKKPHGGSKYKASSPEKTRRYVNPHTGAIIVAKEKSPHKLLRLWREQHGETIMTDWLYDEY